MSTATLEKPLVAPAAVTLTEDHAVKLRKIWTGYGTGPHVIEDWLIYLPRLSAEKRHFPDVEKIDILNHQMNSYVYFLVCKALENNSQEELDAAFVFLEQLMTAQDEHKAVVKSSSLKKMKKLRASIPE